MKDLFQSSRDLERTLKKLYNISEVIVRAEKGKGRPAVSFTGDKEIRALNRRYRKIDRATDVLSFYMGEDGALGDVIISAETAARNARRFGVKLEDELKRLVIHGTLHLLGYDHAGKKDRDKMRRKEGSYGKTIY